MENICVYQKDTGIIRFWTFRKAEDIQDYVPPEGMDFCIATYAPGLTYVIDGVPVSKPVEYPIEYWLKTHEHDLELYVDRVARENGNWKSITSALAASMITGPFQANAISLTAWWQVFWAATYVILDAVVAGQRPVPTLEELIAELPQYSAT